MSARSGRRRAGPHTLPPAPLPIEAAWAEGPRTEAWNELWRRLLAVAFAECGCDEGEVSADSIEGNAHDHDEAAATAGEVQ